MAEPTSERIRSIFAEALAMPPSEQVAYVRRTCGDDADLLARVEELLSAHQQSGGLLPAASEHAAPTSGGRPWR